MTGETTTRTGRRWATILMAGAAGAAIVVGAYLAWPFLTTVADSEELRRLVSDAGAWGPVIYVALQVLQVLIAPIPGQVVSLVGGVLFGAVWGVVYTMIGATIGFTLIFLLTRRLGRPFVERFVSPRLLDRFDYLTDRGGALALFVVFLLPAFPDDLISFIAGLTRLRLRTLILVSLAGRFPGYLALSAAGAGMTHENMNPIIVCLGVATMLGALAYWNRSLLHEMVRSGNMFVFVRDRWTLSPLASVGLVVVLVAAGALLWMAATAEPILP